MYDYKDLKIYLCDVSTSMCKAWRKSFGEAEGFHENIEVFEGNFHDFMTTHPDIDGIVSPANSYGLMDGGYDKAITEWFGTETMQAVQQAIIKEWSYCMAISANLMSERASLLPSSMPYAIPLFSINIILNHENISKLS